MTISAATFTVLHIEDLAHKGGLTVLTELKISGRLGNVESKFMSMVLCIGSPSAGKEDSNNVIKFCSLKSFYITLERGRELSLE